MELEYYRDFITLMHKEGGKENMHVVLIVLYSDTVEHILKTKFRVLLYIGPFVVWDCSSVFLIKYLGHLSIIYFNFGFFSCIATDMYNNDQFKRLSFFS